MADRKHTLTFNLDFDDEFNREIQEMIEARVKAAVRANTQQIVDQIVKDMVPGIANKRFNEVPEHYIKRAISDEVVCFFKSPDGRRMISESTQAKLDQAVDLDLAVRRAVADYVSQKLSKLMPDATISAIVSSILSSVK